LVISLQRTPRSLGSLPGESQPAVAGTPKVNSEPGLATANDPDVWLQVRSVVNQLSVADGRVVALVDITSPGNSSQIVPIIQSPTLAQQIAELPKPDLPPAYVEEVQRAGWRFHTSHQFLSFHYPDGRNQVLPVATHNYRYVGREVF
jgi:hypothetical protein